MQIRHIDLPYITADPMRSSTCFGWAVLANLDTGLLDEAIERGFDIHHQTGALYFLEFNFREGLSVRTGTSARHNIY